MTDPRVTAATLPARQGIAQYATGLRYRPDIEGLRAIAVLIVVAFHFGVPGFKAGFLGVDIFFVISGYLITTLLVDEVGRTGRVSLMTFYGRRVRRLLPASLLATVCTLVVGAYFLSPAEQAASSKAALASSLFSSNFWFLFSTADYFAPESALNPFLHTWSLAVEEQFYLLWPSLITLCAASARRPALMRNVMILIFVVSLVGCVALTAINQPWAFYLVITRAWEFALGGIASRHAVTKFVEDSGKRGFLSGFGAVLLFLCMATMDSTLPFPGIVCLAPCLATAMLLVTGAAGTPSRALAALPMQWIGARSYAIYLWHWPAIVYATIALPKLPWGAVTVATVVTVVGAAVSYVRIETPLRKSAWLAQRPLRSLGLAAFIVLAGSAFALSTGLAASHFRHAPFQAALTEAAQQSPTASGAGRDCLLTFTAVTPVACSFGAASPSKTILLIGDSHADQWSTPLADLALRNGWRLLTLLKASCPFASVPTYNMRLRRESPQCERWRALALQKASELRPDLIVVSEFSSGYIKGEVTALGEHAVDLSTWASGLSTSMAALSRMNVSVLVLRDTPSPGTNTTQCLARADWHGSPYSSCDVARGRAVDDSVTISERAVVTRYPLTQYLDLTGAFCDAATCPARREGTIVYRDANHISNSFAARLGSQLEGRLRVLLAESSQTSASESRER